MQNNDIATELNELYKRLDREANTLEAELTSNGYDCFRSWDNMFTEGSSEPRYYPLPVFTIDGIGTVCIGLEEVYFSVVYNRDALIAMPLENIASRRRFEIFTADDNTESVFPLGGDPRELLPAVLSSSAERLCVCVHILPSQSFERIREVFTDFMPEETKRARNARKRFDR